MNNDIAVRLKGLRKNIGKLTLGPIDIEMEIGYVIAIVGPNGSGKSSLFRLLMNILKPDAGELRIWGKEYEDGEVQLKSRIGYVPEDSQWDEAGCKTINELTRFVSRWYPDWSEAVYRNLLNRYELEGKMKLATLSKGMQRKLAFIHAMSFDPDLLLMDESTSGLDPFAWRLMMDDIVQYMDRGSKTVIFATHILDEVKRLADYVAFMYEGQLIGFYEKDTLMDSWKIFWVESNEQQASAISGVVAVEAKSGASSVRIISQAPAETEAALQRQGIRMLNTQAVELDEILAHLIRQNRIGTMK